MDIIEHIKKAIDNHEEISIVYHGGSQPGASRVIIPIAIVGNKIRARCALSNIAKLFVIDKIEIADTEMVEATPNWKSGITFHQFTTIDEIHAATRDTLDGMGWHVNHGSDFISLHRTRKNGTPLKGSDVSLTYEKMTCDYIFNEDGASEEVNWRERARPWTVRSKERTSKSYSDPDGATDWFMTMASELAVNKKKETPDRGKGRPGVP